MKLTEYLSQKKTELVARWFQLVLETYPPETARFLRKEKNQFANPVGHTLYQGIGGLFEELVHGMDPDRVNHLIGQITRIRAVQDFSPSRAIDFIFILKKVIREELAGEVRANRIPVEELLNFESKIDELALLSFDVYMECREKIYEIRINEVKNRTSRLLRRANLIADETRDC